MFSGLGLQTDNPKRPKRQKTCQIQISSGFPWSSSDDPGSSAHAETSKESQVQDDNEGAADEELRAPSHAGSEAWLPYDCWCFSFINHPWMIEIQASLLQIFFGHRMNGSRTSSSKILLKILRGGWMILFPLWRPGFALNSICKLTAWKFENFKKMFGHLVALNLIWMPYWCQASWCKFKTPAVYQRTAELQWPMCPWRRSTCRWRRQLLKIKRT